ncbi:MAG: hypothetical protein EOP09_13455, partial [Proteobacteria bacterium]
MRTLKLTSMISSLPMRNALRFLGVIMLCSLVLASGCEFNGGNALREITKSNQSSQNQSTLLTVSQSQLAIGNKLTITLSAFNSVGKRMNLSPGDVSFQLTGGTSLGTLTAPVKNLDGDISAEFTATQAGTPVVASVMIFGAPFTTNRPGFVVTDAEASLSKSMITVGQAAVVTGNVTTVTLTTRDSSNLRLTSGGLAVAFSHQGGSSAGTFGAVTDHLDGTYSAVFTGTVIGTATAIQATIGGQMVTSTSPIITVTSGGPASLTVQSGNTQTGIAGSAAASPLVVRVTDSLGNPLLGTSIQWTITSGNGTVSS